MKTDLIDRKNTDEEISFIKKVRKHTIDDENQDLDNDDVNHDEFEREDTRGIYRIDENQNEEEDFIDDNFLNSSINDLTKLKIKNKQFRNDITPFGSNYLEVNTIEHKKNKKKDKRSLDTSPKKEKNASHVLHLHFVKKRHEHV